MEKKKAELSQELFSGVSKTRTVDCVIYPRVSDPTQQEGQSPESQVRRGIFLCEENKWTYWIEDGDLGKSAKTEKLEKRPTLEKIVTEYAPQKLFKYFFVSDLDRSARNPELFGKVKRIFPENGIKIATPDRIYDIACIEDDIASDQAMVHAKAENAKRAKRVKEGHFWGKADGWYTGGYIPYGYTKIKVPYKGEKTKSKYMIDEFKGRVYLRMVEMYEQGIYSADDIATQLNTEGVPAPSKSSVWRPETIVSIFRNEFYTGVIMDKKTRKIKNSKVVPPLIEKERWARLQDLLTQNSSRGTGKAEFSLLRGLCKCSRCGAGLTQRKETDVRRKKGTVYEYKKYKCNNLKIPKFQRAEKKKCDLPVCSTNDLDKIVWNHTLWQILTLDGFQKKLLEKLRSEDDDEKTKEAIAKLEQQIKGIERGQDELLSLVQEGVRSADWFRQTSQESMDKIAWKKSEVEVLKDKLSKESRLEKTLLSYRELSKRIKDGLYKCTEENELTPEKQRLIIQRVVEKVEVDYVGEPPQKLKYKQPFRRDDWSVYISYSFKFNELLSIVKNHIRIPEEANSRPLPCKGSALTN